MPPPNVSDTQPTPNPAQTPRPASPPRPPFPVPIGLFVAIGIYAAAVLGYVNATYWSTPEYQASEHIEQAAELLGGDEGKSLDQKKMEEAYGHYLEACRLVPKERWIHEKLQRLRYKMDERGMTLSRELALRSDALAMLLQRAENEGAPMMVVGLRDRGWTPEQVLGGPKTVALWSIPGGVFISIFFLYRRWTERRVHGEGKEAESKKLENELVDLERARTRGSVNDDGSFRERKGGDVLMQGREKRPKKAAPKGEDTVPDPADRKFDFPDYPDEPEPPRPSGQKKAVASKSGRPKK